MTLTLEQAKTLLNSCDRYELRDHAFGDVEVSWTKDDKDVASGYDGASSTSVYFHDGACDEPTNVVFRDQEAIELLKCGTLRKVERNDSTGPDEFTKGECMPGLTPSGVLDELVNK